MIILKNELLKSQGKARGARAFGKPWAPQPGDPALRRTQNRKIYLFDFPALSISGGQIWGK